MNKNGIKKFAIEARRELLSRVSQRALLYGISEEDIGNPSDDTAAGHILSIAEKKERAHLIERIEEKGYQEVMEEVAYTWFNRISALRFMEVNGYLPGHLRVFTDEDNAMKPQILTEAAQLDLDGLSLEKVDSYLEADDKEGLYKYLLITLCNALADELPGTFQEIADYTELLFPDNLLREGSVLHRMVELIPEEDWKDQVQIIGWLYQYYNSEKKDEAFAKLKKNIKITKENIPAATQLFTPDWIVRYMVENSLGRLWLEGHEDAKETFLPTAEEKEAYAKGHQDAGDPKWYYYLTEAPQEEKVEEELTRLRKDYGEIEPEDIRVIDPCSGSGHILAYIFDVLMGIYTAYGYTARDAARCIVEKNLYGLDIDDRAAQLSYFAVMMKGRRYDRSFLRRGIRPHVVAIQDGRVAPALVEEFAGGKEELKKDLQGILQDMKDGKEYGSILTTKERDWDALYARLADIEEEDQVSLYRDDLLALRPLVESAHLLSMTYDVVVTNPPYMGASNMSDKLNDFVKKNYPDSKSDMSTVCMERVVSFCKSNGYWGMINIPVWMFLSSYEKLRQNLLKGQTIINMVHPGRGIFGSDFGTTAFVYLKQSIAGYEGEYRRLFDKLGEVVGIDVREQAFLSGKGKFIADQSNFFKIPGAPVAYWVSETFINAFENDCIRNHAIAVKGLDTCDNDTFTRMWYEVERSNLSLTKEDATDTYTHKWYPYCKGGGYSKWYGFMDRIVNWENNGEVLRSIRDSKGKIKSRPQNIRYYFKEGLTWSTVTSYKLSLRYMNNCIFGGGGSAMFCAEDMYVYLGFLNSCVTEYALAVLNPTLNFLVGDILSLPVIDLEEKKSLITNLAQENIESCKVDWDSYETSWDFRRHPMVRRGTLADAYEAWKGECEARFQKLKANEEELNRIFIDIYGLADELTPTVADRDVTVHRIFDTKEEVPESMKGSSYVRTKRDEVVSLISYAVGCMLGRYSLDAEGLAYAGGDWDASKYGTFAADADNVIPICDDAYFDDDILGRFVDFLKAAYGEDTLEENLRFIAEALGGTGAARDVLRSYFLNDFYKDHCKTYQKRPIYWLFDSGKKNGFKALIYLHRYRSDTIARIRTDYVHEQQARYRTAIADLMNRKEAASGSEKVKLTKRLKTLEDQAAELQAYEEKVHHLADQMISLDLDDGVKVNYSKLQDVLAKIK